MGIPESSQLCCPKCPLVCSLAENISSSSPSEQELGSCQMWSGGASPFLLRLSPGASVLAFPSLSVPGASAVERFCGVSHLDNISAFPGAAGAGFGFPGAAKSVSSDSLLPPPRLIHYCYSVLCCSVCPLDLCFLKTSFS